MNKGIIALFFIVAGLAGLTFFMSDKEEVSNESVLFLPELEKNINAVSSIDIRVAGGDNITVYKSGDTWKLKQKSDYAADFSKVRKLVIELSELTVLAEKTKKPENFSKLGVEDVAIEGATSKQIVVYGQDDAELAAIIVGDSKNQGPGNRSLFVRRVDNPQVWKVEGVVTLSSQALDWLDNGIVDVKKEQIASVQITHPDGSKVSIARLENAEGFALDGLAANQVLESESSLDNIANALNGLTFDDVMKKIDFEFAESALVSTKFSLTSNEVLNVSTVELEGKFFLWLSVPSNDSVAENTLLKLRSDVADWVFEVPKHKVENFRRTHAALVKDKAVD